MIVYYTLQYKKEQGKWLIWKNVESEGGIGFRCIFEGNKYECQRKLKELNGKRRVYKKNNRKSNI